MPEHIASIIVPGGGADLTYLEELKVRDFPGGCVILSILYLKMISSHHPKFQGVQDVNKEY